METLPPPYFWLYQTPHLAPPGSYHVQGYLPETAPYIFPPRLEARPSPHLSLLDRSERDSRKRWWRWWHVPNGVGSYFYFLPNGQRTGRAWHSLLLTVTAGAVFIDVVVELRRCGGAVAIGGAILTLLVEAGVHSDDDGQRYRSFRGSFVQCLLLLGVVADVIRGSLHLPFFFSAAFLLVAVAGVVWVLQGAMMKQRALEDDPVGAAAAVGEVDG